jgi:diacylglycerol O-acyltransferase
MSAAYPLGPLFLDQALNIALLSYDGRLRWGLNADWDVLPDLRDLVTAIRLSLDELLQVTEN